MSKPENEHHDVTRRLRCPRQETLSLEGFLEYEARVREQGEDVDPSSEVSEAFENCTTS